LKLSIPVVQSGGVLVLNG